MNPHPTQDATLSGEKRMPVGTLANPALAQQLLDAFDQLQGLHPGFRPAHAKGLMCSGTFAPSPEAAKLTRAPHANRPSTPVTVLYSDSTGLPNIPDNDPARSGPRGIALRFHLDEHLHTDIIAHSFDGFPVRTGEEFLEFLRAAAAAGAGRPEALGAFLAAHPNAKRFVEAPKPIPTSFAHEAFFAVTAFKFTNSSGAITDENQQVVEHFLKQTPIHSWVGPGRRRQIQSRGLQCPWHSDNRHCQQGRSWCYSSGQTRAE